MYFEGSFTGSTLDALYGSIKQVESTIVEMTGNTDEFISQNKVSLYIPYTVDTASSPATYPVDVTSFEELPKFSASLLEKESRFRLYWIAEATDPETYESLGRRANVNHSNASTVESVLPVENIRVILTPKIGSSTSSNPDVTIDSITEGTPRLSLSITSETGFDCDYQLRTSSLFLDDGEGNITENVFYKVGIVPFNKQYSKYGNGASVNTPSTVAGLKTTLTSSRLYICTDSTYMQGCKLYYSLLGVDFACGEQWSNDYEFWDSKVPLSFIVPIKNDNDKFVGLLYARMFKQNGEEVNPADVSSYDLKLYYKTSENDPNPQIIEHYDGVDTQPLLFTDQSMSGGWVQSPTND